jgi:hypothetical protein
MQQQQKEGDYLENDIERMKNQLDQLKNDIKHMNEKIRVDSSLSNNIESVALLCIVEEESTNRSTSESMSTKDKVTREKKKSILNIKANKVKDNYDCDICLESSVDDDIFIFGCEESHKACYDCFARLCRVNMKNKKVLTCGSCAYQLQDSEIKQLRVAADEKRKYLEYQTKKTSGAFRFKLPF